VTISSNIGSFDSLNPRVRRGLSPASARSAGNQAPGTISDPPHRPTPGGEVPTASAIALRHQWVTFGGVARTVLVITLSRVSQSDGGPREGRVSSRLSPSYAHVNIALLPALDGGFGHISAHMISLRPPPFAIANTLRARRTTFRGVFRSASKASS
jgi:hypothetical protein